MIQRGYARRRVRCLMLLLIVVLGTHAAGQGAIPEEQFAKWLGSVTLKRLSTPLKWDPDPLFDAMDARAGKSLPRAEKLAILDSGSKWAAMTNAFWNGSDFKQGEFRLHVERLTLVPIEAESDWGKALSKYEGTDPLGQMLVLGPLVMQDRLFAGGKWQPGESVRLLARLKSLPEAAASTWAERRELDKFTAAISLIRIDTFFVNNAFQSVAFDKMRR